MELERYDFKVTANRYLFISMGPKGRIKKMVKFDLHRGGRPAFYTLSFGDWLTGEMIDDKIITNNRDSHKILATVAATVVDFMDKNPDALILAMGSTPARTRLYQMNINKYLPMIGALFVVEGFIRGAWQPFKYGPTYTAFLLKHKKYLNL